MAEPWGTDPTAWTLDGRVMHVTRPPLVPLIGLVMSHSPVDIVLRTLRDQEDQQFLYLEIMDPESLIATNILQDIADTLVLEWFGMPRWTVQEIWWRVLGSWADVDGELTMRGVDLMTLSPARATATAKALLAKWVSADKDRAEELQRDLTSEPLRILRRKEAASETPEAVEEAAYDWGAAMELMKQHQGGT